MVEIQTGNRRLTSLGQCAEAFVTILQIFSSFLNDTFKQWAFHLQSKKYMLKANIHIVWKCQFSPERSISPSPPPPPQEGPHICACPGFLPVTQMGKKNTIPKMAGIEWVQEAMERYNVW